MRCNPRNIFSALLITFAITGIVAPAIAAPMYGEPWQLKQPDGTMVDVLIWGDEYYQIVESLDGYTLMRDPGNQEIVYAQLSRDGRELESTGIRVGTASPTGLGIQPHVRISPESRHEKVVKARMEADVPMPGEFYKTTLPPPSTGNVTGLVLIIDFSDNTSSIAASEIDDYCNQPGYNGNSNNGSVKDYFSDISDGLLNYSSFVLPQYHRASQPFSYYDDCGTPWLQRARELIIEVLDSLETEGHDFTVYDSNGDNYIDALNVFYAGNTGCGWSQGMWPGSSGMKDQWTSGSGISTDRFQITGIGTSLTLGTYCHENGHMVGGWPDLYDYDFDSNGVGRWCLMASQYGTNPQEPCGYLKVQTGWTTPTTINSDQFNYSLGPASNNANLLKFPSGNANEYFMAEYRGNSDRDSFLPGAGLLITHIDENGNNSWNQATADSHFAVTVVQADGLWELENNTSNGDAEDLYVAPSRTALTPCTNPDTDWWDGSQSGYHFTGVGFANPSSILFDFTIGDQAPVAQCKSYQADADTDCCITVTVSNIDDDSYDPNGSDDIESILITAVDGQPVTAATSVEVCGDGLHDVTLTVTDRCGNESSCDAQVEVVNSPPVALCKSYSADADSNCCIVVHKDDIDDGSYDPDGIGDIASFGITAVDGNPTIGVLDSVEVCGNGMHTVTLTITDWCDSTSSCDADVEVIDVTPPDLIVELDRYALWPPNHKMVDIEASVQVTDNCDPDPYWELYEISSNEDDNGQGDGNFPDDIQDETIGAEDTTFALRSERSGKGDGRKYTIIYRAEDESGNVAFDTSCVEVPHDQSGMAKAAFGFNPSGTGFELGETQFTIVIPSHEAEYETKGRREVLVKPALDATTMDASQVYVGNTAGVLSPMVSRALDANDDGLKDLVVTYRVSLANGVLAATEWINDPATGRIADGPLGLHYKGADGTNWLVSDIFAMGDRVTFRDDDVADEPRKPKEEDSGILGAPGAETVQYSNDIESIFPNPFNPRTTVRFTLAEASNVTIAVYDVKGSLVRTLVDRSLSAGAHTVGWDGIDAQGRSVATGVYFARMVTGGFETTRKMVLLK